MRDPVRVLIVCTANICRSPYAQLRGAALAGQHPGVELFSAGTHALDGQPMDPELARHALARGAVEVDEFRSQRLTRDHVDGADLILAAGRRQQAFVLEQWPSAFLRVFTAGQFAAAAGSADEAAVGRELIRWVARHRPAGRRDQDVADPYGRGAAAAAACADHLDSLLTVLIPRLAGAAGHDPSTTSESM